MGNGRYVQVSPEIIEKSGNTAKSNYEITHKRKECIQEPFIWYVAQELVLAAKTMANGFSSPKEAVVEDGEAPVEVAEEEPWTEILHLSIKPHNILMSAADPESMDEIATRHGWPRIQVTDFGASMENRPEWQNPQDIAGRGTTGYMAPEQCRQINHRNTEKYPLERLTSKTMVWGIGAVLYDLCNLRICLKT